MLIRHATFNKHLASINRHGLLCSKSQGRMLVVWGHKPSRSHWALAHTVKRHGGRIEDVVILEISVPRSWLKRHGRRGVWYSVSDIGPERIRCLIEFSDLAA